jgi:hypothetical protein
MKGSHRRSRTDRVIGLIVTLFITAYFLWGALQWIQRDNWPPPPNPRRIPHNERKALASLRSIREAQEKYREKDWDEDGRRVYASFLVHLWQSVDKSGGPIEVRLIPRQLAFAMTPRLAVDGYYFEDIHTRGPEENRMDPAEDWAMVALPVAQGKTGVLTFLIDSSGSVWAKACDRETIRFFPAGPASKGWEKIGSPDDLAALQEERGG